MLTGLRNHPTNNSSAQHNKTFKDRNHPNNNSSAQRNKTFKGSSLILIIKEDAAATAAAADAADTVRTIKDAVIISTHFRRPIIHHLQCPNLSNRSHRTYHKDKVSKHDHHSHYSNPCNTGNHAVPHQIHTSVATTGTTVGHMGTTSVIIIRAQTVSILPPVMCGMPRNRIRAEEVRKVNIK